MHHAPCTTCHSTATCTTATSATVLPLPQPHCYTATARHTATTTTRHHTPPLHHTAPHTHHTTLHPLTSHSCKTSTQPLRRATCAVMWGSPGHIPDSHRRLLGARRTSTPACTQQRAHTFHVAIVTRFASFAASRSGVIHGRCGNTFHGAGCGALLCRGTAAGGSRRRRGRGMRKLPFAALIRLRNRGACFCVRFDPGGATPLPQRASNKRHAR